MHEAEKYLRDIDKPNSLHVKYMGQKRKLFINNPPKGSIGIMRKRAKKMGSCFYDWENVTQLYKPKDYKAEAERREAKFAEKYRKEATKASFTNPFIRKCLSADPTKSPYENGITTGNNIDGEIISLNAIAKYSPIGVAQFKEAIRDKKTFNTCRFKFRGYDGSLSLTVITEDGDYYKKGDIAGYFSKEFVGTGNGYYYLLINEDKFIGYDID